VCNADGALGDDVLGALTELVHHNLVRQREGDDAEPRFAMLETIREFALEQFEACSEAAEVRRLHAVYVLSFARGAAPHLNRSGRAPWMHALTREQDNLRAALRWTVANDSAEIGLRLIATLGGWFYREATSEGYQWSADVLALPSASQPTRMRAQALVAAGILAMASGNRQSSRRWLEESVAIARAESDLPLLAHALGWLGQAMGIDDLDAARQAGEEAVARLRMLNRPWRLALGLSGFGRTLTLLGDVTAARQCLEEAVELYRAEGDSAMIGLPLRNLGQLALWHGDYATARERLEESLAAFRAAEERLNAVAVLAELGWLAYHERHAREAAAWFRVCLDAARGLGATIWIATALQGFAGVAVLQGDLVGAARVLGAAATLQGNLAQGEIVIDALAEQVVADVRARLGDAAFDAAWHEGQALSPEQIVAEALAVAERQEPGIDAHTGPNAAGVPGGLSPRELEVLRLLAAGRSNPEIAAALVISRHSVERHVNHILAKTGAANRVEAAAFAHRHGLVK
jgi:DNA-binding CsgD family transcriptional regulator/tetratricopeptide (TPR) repeat protein